MEVRPELVGMRWQVLRALRDLTAGAVLVVRTDPATQQRQTVVFEGQTLPQLTGAILLRLAWVQPKRPHWMPHASFYELSPSGVAALEAGLRWWRSQPLLYRIVLRAIE